MIRVERIKQLIDREGISQKDLAEKIGMKPQHLSRSLTSGRVSEKTCQMIAECFPEYSLTWLLGLTDFMTKEDEEKHAGFEQFYKRTEDRYNKSILTIRHLAELRNIDFKLYSSGMLQDETGRFVDCFVIHKDDKTAYINYNDLSDLVEDLSALVESRLSRAINKSIKSDL